MDFGSPQAFIGIYISDSCQHCLVQYRRFDGCPRSSSYALNKHGCSEFITQWLRADFLHKVYIWYFYSWNEAHPAKLTLVIEVQMALIGKFQRYPGAAVRQIANQAVIRMPCPKNLLTAEYHLSGHLQMNY